MELLYWNSLLEGHIWQDRLGLTTRLLGDAAGSQGFYVNVDTVPHQAGRVLSGAVGDWSASHT
ncbi:hypothetical protein [Pseudoflavonifractor sp. 524-17]|uniref:hypothetical protein n=1 Tax=Pseudoflavonifractor sp. 524-17 TaxID=2304577 RepID=UPI00192A204E|nr:hypothetical protein [Pseudoflavonifractor sp. 524-17]